MIKYKLMEGNTIKDKESGYFIPIDSGNRHFVEFCKKVKEEGLSIVEGVDLPDYKQLRLTDREKGYPSIGDQLDVLYHEGTEAWKKIIKEAKEQYPKEEPKIADLPEWVKELVDGD
tara:strand:- start:41 stop:388 length:348 start_codon:yes stop_codon:yes gene_type:complete